MMNNSLSDLTDITKQQKTVKLGILVSHPIQYFVPVYRQLAKRSDIELTVIYRTRVGIDAYHDSGFGQTLKWDIPLLDGYSSHFLSSKTVLAGFELGIVKELLSHRFDVMIVHGYNSLTNILAIGIAKLLGTRVIIRGDTRLQRHHQQTPLWKNLFKRLLFKICDGFLTIGSLNRDYYLAFGANPECLFFAPFCVDNSAFSLSAEQHLIQRQQFRKTLSLPENCTVILFASKFIALKKADDLIKAFARLHLSFPEACLIMAGSGEQECVLRTMVKTLCVERVYFIGFQNQSTLPSLYAASDMFVLPSAGDSWGLVLNEVMASGLPVIVSDEVGAAPDLVCGQCTGIVYPCGDVDALTTALESLLKSEKNRQQMGNKAYKLIQKWDAEVCATKTASAVISVANLD